MRHDGRAQDELRPLDLVPGFVETADGSVLFSIGRTRVICTASVDAETPRWLRGSGRGWVSAEYGMLPPQPASASSVTPRAGGPTAADRDPAADRALAARDRRLAGARRTHRVGRLRRAAGRRRHALRVDLRRLRRPLPRTRGARRPGRAARVAADRGRRCRVLRHRRGRARARPRLHRGLERRGRQRRDDERRPPRRAAGHRRGPAVRPCAARSPARARGCSGMQRIEAEQLKAVAVQR